MLLITVCKNVNWMLFFINKVLNVAWCTCGRMVSLWRGSCRPTAATSTLCSSPSGTSCSTGLGSTCPALGADSGGEGPSPDSLPLALMSPTSFVVAASLRSGPLTTDVVEGLKETSGSRCSRPAGAIAVSQIGRSKTQLNDCFVGKWYFFSTNMTN